MNICRYYFLSFTVISKKKKSYILSEYELHMMAGGIIVFNRVSVLLTGANTNGAWLSKNGSIDHSLNCEIVHLSWF